MHKKGQAATELLIILAVSIVVLIAIYSYSATSIAGLQKQQIVETAQISVQDLANAANDVYAQGVGAKKRVFYTVPTNVDQSKSGIEQNAFVINVLESDVYAGVNTCLLGSLPVDQGGHFIWLTAQEQCVFVGIENISLNKTSSYVTLNQNDSEEDTVTLTNNGTEAADIFLTRNWTEGDVNLSLDTYSFTLNPSQSQLVTLTYTSGPTASGTYAGNISVDAAFASGDENNSLPVTAEVLVSGGGVLAIFPATRTSNLMSNNIDNNSFETCNNSNNTLMNISFSDSGTIANWIDPISTITSLGAGMCKTTNYTLTVPGATSAGSYTGIITATDGTNSDEIEITVIVIEMKDCFNFDWSTASFDGPGKHLDNWTIENTCDSTISISQMKVRKWSENDLDNALLDKIKLNNNTRWQDGAGVTDADIWRDIDADFTIAAATSYSNNNKLEFNDNINDDYEEFYIVFGFSDGSSYTTPVYPVNDLDLPIVTLEAPADANTYDSYNTLFSYNVTDGNSGIASCELLINGASDQTDNSITEGITQSFTKTFTSNATYGWDVNCTDDSTNSNESGSDLNRQITINVPLQSTNFNFSWSTASFDGPGKHLDDWTIENLGSSTITITRMKVREWSVNDNDNAKLKKIKLNNNTRWDGGGGVTDADIWRDIDADFTIAAATAYSNNNKLEFTKKVNDDGEDFYLVFEFSDGSTYTTSTYDP